MSGYKQTVKNDGAVSFWTFDGDAFDNVSRKLIVPEGEPPTIIDEIDGNNTATLISDHATYLGYRMGMPSLVYYEPEDQYSISFGYYGLIPQHPNQYPISYLDIPNSTTYVFTDNGSFSVEFMMRLSSTASAGYGVFPIFTKPGTLTVNISAGPTGHSLSITHPGGSASIAATYSENNPWKGGSWIDKNIHFIFTWGVIEVEDGIFQATARVMLNTCIAYEASYTYYDIPPNTSTSTSINIGGTSSTYWKSRFDIDQIAIYDRALSVSEIIRHVSKISPYESMLKDDGASNIWLLDDITHTTDFNIYPYKGSITGTYMGGASRINRYQPGPENIYNSRSCYFTNGGGALFLNTYQSRYVPIDIDTYSYEFWFNSIHQDIGILFAAQSLEFPYVGPLIELNVQSRDYKRGSIQFSESVEDGVINSREVDDFGEHLEYNDGQWHHIVITKEISGLVSLYIDGILHGTRFVTVKTMGQPGQIHLMTSMPGNRYISGYASHLAKYDFALQSQQVEARHSYTTIYKICGIVTLLGVPYQANVRFYSSHTGQLLRETESDPWTGEYCAYFSNNSNIDILVASRDDESVRYRAYGPVKPAEVIDLPITI